ncbi:MAG: hypothetical protein NUV92_06005 [Ignavibacteria bacterium]|jgi:hypothetical protein|nr:hypothetical protein [Ignavibacteria bacterium]MDH7527577.1 hypothetical protein [Ignavibacteria bacterium]NPV12254.1 hypothetical protein [Ignavibacteria bacterium]
MKNKILIIVSSSLVLINLLGCPGAKRDELEFYRGQVDSLRNVISNFVIEYNQLKYESYVQNQPFLISNLYKKYDKTFSQNDIDLINNLLKLEQRPERIERLERLKVFIYEKIVEKETAQLQDQIERLKNEITFSTRKGKFKLDDLKEYLTNESNPRLRKSVYNSNLNSLENLQKLQIQLLEKRKKIILDSLNFGSYLQFASMIRQEDLSKFYSTVNDFISSTNDFYFQQLYELLRIQRYSQDYFNSSDIYSLTKDPRYERYFKSDSLQNIFLRTFYQIGFKIDSLPNLQIAFEQRDKRKAKLILPVKTRGFTIRIPEQSNLILDLANGCESYYKAFSECGKLLPELFTKNEFFEIKYFGGDVIPLTFSNLFGNLLDEEKFLEDNLFNSSRVISNFLKQRSFNKLFNVRKLCADFIVEYLMIDSSQTNPDSLIQIYNSILGFNLLPGDKARLFLSLNDYFAEVEQLNAIFTEAMMKTRIREKFGNVWFKNSDLRTYLMNFFTKNRELSKDKFLVEIGYYNLDPRFFFNEVISLKEKSKILRQR